MAISFRESDMAFRKEWDRFMFRCYGEGSQSLSLTRSRLCLATNTEKRKLVDGRWVRPDPAAAGALAWLRADSMTRSESRSVQIER